MIALTLVCLGILGAASADGPVVIDADPAARQPQAAVDAEGRVHVAYGAGAEIRCATSTDGGRHFDAPVVVGRLPTLALGMRRGPRIAATQDALIIAAIGGDQGMGRDGDLFTWRSTNHGATWTGPVRINAVEGSAREGLHALAAHPDGGVFAVWLDLRDGAMALYGARSTDHGATWEADRLVHRSPDKAICTCCHPSAAFGPDGLLYLMWRDDVAGARDMYLARSRDGGQSFGRPQKLGRRSWVVAQCPMDGGAVAADPGDDTATIWMRAGEVFACRPGAAEVRLGTGAQPWAAPARDGTHAVWLARRPGPLMHVVLDADAAPEQIAEAANDPILASGPGGRGPTVVAWEQAGDARGVALRVIASVPE
jgi:hypothetical protein